MDVFSFEKLETWQFAKKFALRVYQITDSFPKKEQFGLVSQLNRAAISIPSNIAEGTSRSSMKEKMHFIEIAYGSLMEVACQLDISYDLGFVNEVDYDNAKKEMLRLIKMLSKLKKSFSSINDKL